jgi:lysylphosphatidylglycerol synthetase-like protein (DUF2156 family)
MTPHVVGAAILGAALCGCAIYGGVRKSGEWILAYLILNPIYAAVILFYVLPHEYKSITSLQVDFLVQLYGSSISGAVIAIFAESVIMLLCIVSWMYVWKCALKNRARNRPNRPLCARDYNESDSEDHPYRRRSHHSYL